MSKKKKPAKRIGKLTPEQMREAMTEWQTHKPTIDAAKQRAEEAAKQLKAQGVEDCPACDGLGTIDGKTCESCEGEGFIQT
jgi:DnaJ-class molecular chaperone